MIKAKDLYTYYTIQPLKDPSGNQVGFTIISYEIRRYNDLRNLGNSFSYQIICTQRVVIPNSSPYSPTSVDSPTMIFESYPAVLSNTISFNTGTNAVEMSSYFPRTLNSSVNTSVSSSTGDSSSATMQHTSGSSTSQSNSFGVSASLGFFGEEPTGDASAGYTHTWGSERSKSTTTGSDKGTQSENSGSASMSVKDWACSSYVMPDGSICWVWGQEYPWDVVRYNAPDSLPQFIQQLLYDSKELLPPSQLSQFGIDFTMKVAWIVQPVGTSVTLAHNMSYCTATHQLTVASGFSASINDPIPFNYLSPTLDLCKYGLDPLAEAGSASVAIIGFVPRQFLTLPVPAQGTSSPTAFEILSASNNLLIEDTTVYGTLTSADSGAGFSPSQTALTATFTPGCQSLTMTATFKLTDTINVYNLLMKHWTTNASAGVMLTIVINGDVSSQIVKFVDALEGEGGESNLLSISLRDLSYGSVNYHDYLNLGVNTIEITLTPATSNASSGYQIRALSIEKE